MYAYECIGNIWDIQAVPINFVRVFVHVTVPLDKIAEMQRFSECWQGSKPVPIISKPVCATSLLRRGTERLEAGHVLVKIANRPVHQNDMNAAASTAAAATEAKSVCCG